MQNDNIKILNRIKKEYKNPYLRLTSKIDFFERSSSIVISLKSAFLTGNMQTDENAFESWALVLKRCFPDFKIILTWPMDTIDEVAKNPHYQRLLFRAIYFAKDFGWFEIAPDLGDHIKLALQINESDRYFLNVPGPRENEDGGDPERVLEMKFFKKDGKYHQALTDLFDLEFIDRRLPVGLFHERVSEENTRLPRHGSAIDFWAVNKQRELLLFELKTATNTPIGIISELYFYTVLLHHVLSGRFQHEFNNNENINKIAGLAKIRSFFVAENLHSTIDKKLVAILSKGKYLNATFHFVQINSERESLQLLY